MLRNNGRRDKKNLRRVVRFPGIGTHAKALGYTRIHLYLLLTGARPWQPGMKRRYQQLLKSEAAK